MGVVVSTHSGTSDFRVWWLDVGLEGHPRMDKHGCNSAATNMAAPHPRAKALRRLVCKSARSTTQSTKITQLFSNLNRSAATDMPATLLQQTCLQLRHACNSAAPLSQHSGETRQSLRDRGFWGLGLRVHGLGLRASGCGAVKG